VSLTIEGCQQSRLERPCPSTSFVHSERRWEHAPVCEHGFDSIGVADGHGRKAQAHAFIQHADVMVECVVCSGSYFELVASAQSCQQEESPERC